MLRIWPIFICCLWTLIDTNCAAAAPLARFDFTTADGADGWVALHDISSMQKTQQGLLIRISGNDPYIAGPARDYPADQPLWLRIRLKSDQDGMGQVFYFQRNATEEASIRFDVAAGTWTDLKLPLPPLGKGFSLRFDPPGSGGTCLLALIEVEPRLSLKEPAWLAPQAEDLAKGLEVKSGNLVLTQGSHFGGFSISADGKRMADGHNRPLIGYLAGDAQRWLDVRELAQCRVARPGNGVQVVASMKDNDGATWQITQRFSPGSANDAIDVATDVQVDQDRQLVSLPLLVLCPGVGTFGQSKDHALFAGLEYLDKDEPSSSEADIIGPGSKRQVPDTEKITLPLMTVANDGRYVGLIWEAKPEVAALFDSPDRIFKSGGHVMGLVCPGSNGVNRIDASVLPQQPMLLAAGKPLRVRATIIGGKGESVVPAVQQYVAMRGLPEVPDTGLSLAEYAKLAAGGWLDSKCREANRFRHAWPGGFQPAAVADATLWMDWLAARVGDRQVSEKLSQTAADALSAVNPDRYNFAAVSHVRYPVPALLYGNVAENAAVARQQGFGLLSRFEPDGSVPFRKSPNGQDYARTHFAPDANGLTAQLVNLVLESATVGGDAKLITEGLRLLRAMDKFANSAPRGAQTWECPLHTPDILASAHLVRAYTMGYELSGDEHLLDMAKYWAWTGVPFIYLVQPTDKPVGPYATIAVYGATNWQAPNWMGLPVQWCGLVYADALYRFAKYDPKTPWRQIADGITASGIQQTFPSTDRDRQGLLPDSYALRAGVRNNPGINPGTVQANAVRLYKRPEVYSFHCFRKSGLMVHAPGNLADLREDGDSVSFKVSGCIKESYWVLVAGVKREMKVRINGADAGEKQVQYVRDGGWVVLNLKGDAVVEVR